MWADALLGGLDGALGYATDSIAQKDAAKAKAAADKKAFQQEILKGVILQSMKPKSKDLDFSSGLVEGEMGGMMSPDFLKMLQGLMKRKASAGGGGTNRPPPIFGPTNPPPKKEPKVIVLSRD